MYGHQANLIVGNRIAFIISARSSYVPIAPRTYVLLHSHDIVAHSRICSLSHFREERLGNSNFVSISVLARALDPPPRSLSCERLGLKGDSRIAIIDRVCISTDIGVLR